MKKIYKLQFYFMKNIKLCIKENFAAYTDKFKALSHGRYNHTDKELPLYCSLEIDVSWSFCFICALENIGYYI